jgi:hypothetical protein
VLDVYFVDMQAQPIKWFNGGELVKLRIFFENKMDVTVPFDLEKLKNLKEMNISYNMFNGFVSRNLAKLDTLNMTMINEQGVATTLKVSIDKNSAYAADE